VKDASSGEAGRTGSEKDAVFRPPRPFFRLGAASFCEKETSFCGKATSFCVAIARPRAVLGSFGPKETSFRVGVAFFSFRTASFPVGDASPSLVVRFLS
jgi:hypothetical protein